MNRSILLPVTAPAVLIGLFLCGTCLVSAWYIHRLQTNMANVLSRNVASLQAALALYGQVVARVVPVGSVEVAETAKLLENTYRAVNIALVKELKMVCDRLGIDALQVIDAAATKPFGFQPFYPGRGWAAPGCRPTRSSSAGPHASTASRPDSWTLPGR